MSDHATPICITTYVDELVLAAWVHEGLDELERYLADHAAFAEFLRERGRL